MKHVVVVRANFSDNELFENYLKVAKDTFFPSVNSQTSKNFTLCFTVNEKHKEIIRELIDPKINTLFFKNITEIQKFLQQEFYEIQTRHDFDDWMRENYIQKIRFYWKRAQLLEPNIRKILIQSQPDLYDYNNSTIKKMRTRYSTSPTSMHLSLCQLDNVHFIFEDSHNKMGTRINNVKMLLPGSTRLVIHSNNKLSNLNS